MASRLFVLAVLVLLELPEQSSPSEISPELIVHTKSGRVQGRREVAPNGKEVNMWWGIPYAEPPIGKLRFKGPKPVKKWSGVREAFRKPNSCVQIKDTLFPGFEGAEMWNANTPISEDCLYLNIAVPVPPPKDSAIMTARILGYLAGSLKGHTLDEKQFCGSVYGWHLEDLCLISSKRACCKINCATPWKTFGA